jgi:hypothetical protein
MAIMSCGLRAAAVTIVRPAHASCEMLMEDRRERKMDGTMHAGKK